jgi:hypothetical protein
MLGDVLRVCGFSIAGEQSEDRLQQLNSDILNELGGGWDYPPPLAPDWVHDERLFPLMTKARLLLQGRTGNAPWGWQDPSCSLTLPCWRSLHDKLKVVVCLRSPLEVVLSLQQQRCSPALALSLWTTYNERALQAMSAATRLITHFDAYFHQPEREIRKLLEFLNVPLSDPAVHQAAQAVIPERRHHQYTTQHLLDAGLSSNVLRLYMAMCEEAGWLDDGLRLAHPVAGRLPAGSLPQSNGQNGGPAPVAVGRFDRRVVEAELLRRQLGVHRPQGVPEPITTPHQAEAAEDGERLRNKTAWDSRVADLAHQRDAAQSEAAELRMHLARMSERERELRQMLIEAHDRLLRQDEAHVKALTGAPSADAKPAEALEPLPAVIMVDEMALDSAKLAGFTIDKPSSGNPPGEDDIEVSGWVVGRQSPVFAVEVLGREGSLRRSSVNLPRLDIAAAHPEFPGADVSGFDLVVPVHELARERKLVVQAVLQDGSYVALAAIRLKKPSPSARDERKGQHVERAKQRPQIDPAKQLEYRQAIERAHELIRGYVPPEATVLIVSKGDEALLKVDGRHTRHFPQDEHGRYAGYHPADSVAAIHHLESLCAKGAQFLLFPKTAFWWLDHYKDFGNYLDAHHRRLIGDDNCIIFQLLDPDA